MSASALLVIKLLISNLFWEKVRATPGFLVFAYSFSTTWISSFTLLRYYFLFDTNKIICPLKNAFNDSQTIPEAVFIFLEIHSYASCESFIQDHLKDSSKIAIFEIWDV